MITSLFRSLGLLALGLFLAASAHAQDEEAPANGLTMHVFMSETCPHCRAQKPFLANLDSYYPTLEVRQMEIMTTREHHELLRNMAALHGVQPGSVPMIFVGGKVWVGDSRDIRREIAAHVEACLSESGCPR
ncbi:MAG: glutaredoxin family protein [Wenzhouxiangella sp.]